jgi:hypothetical protein
MVGKSNKKAPEVGEAHFHHLSNTLQTRSNRISRGVRIAGRIRRKTPLERQSLSRDYLEHAPYFG